jgi:hypothetical protein
MKESDPFTSHFLPSKSEQKRTESGGGRSELGSDRSSPTSAR